jgi:RHS repeat-associated protein
VQKKTSAKGNIGGLARLLTLALLLLFPLAAAVSAAEDKRPRPREQRAPAAAPAAPRWNVLDELRAWEGVPENSRQGSAAENSLIPAERFLIKPDSRRASDAASGRTAVASEKYFFGDALQSVHQVTNATGAVVRTQFTDAWGNDLDLGIPNLPTGSGDRYGFQGRENDSESGLMHFRARSYDPMMGRFTSRDPVWHPNLYHFADNDPVNKTDPSGRDVPDYAYGNLDNALREALEALKGGDYDTFRQKQKLGLDLYSSYMGMAEEGGLDDWFSSGQKSNEGARLTPYGQLFASLSDDVDGRIKAFLLLNAMDSGPKLQEGEIMADRLMARNQQLALLQYAEGIAEGYGKFLTELGTDAAFELSGLLLLKYATRSAAAVDDALAIRGRAQSPSMKWAPNAGGARQIDDVAAIARKRGVSVPDDVVFFVDDALPANVDAQYFRWNSGQGNVLWKDFYNMHGKIPVRIKSSVLASDEAIVAVLGHEMHELNNLRTLFKARGKMTPQELEALIGVGRRGNLHDEAWDVADELVRQMRSGK